MDAVAGSFRSICERYETADSGGGGGFLFWVLNSRVGL